jgi:hypothetical protein
MLEYIPVCDKCGVRGLHGVAALKTRLGATEQGWVITTDQYLCEECGGKQHLKLTDIDGDVLELDVSHGMDHCILSIGSTYDVPVPLYVTKPMAVGIIDFLQRYILSLDKT